MTVLRIRWPEKVLTFPLEPVRAIVVEPVPGGWQARVALDRGTRPDPRFRRSEVYRTHREAYIVAEAMRQTVGIPLYAYVPPEFAAQTGSAA